MDIIGHYSPQECPEHSGQVNQVVGAKRVNAATHEDIPRQGIILRFCEVKNADPSKVDRLAMASDTRGPLLVSGAQTIKILHLLADLLLCELPIFRGVNTVDGDGRDLIQWLSQGRRRCLR